MDLSPLIEYLKWPSRAPRAWAVYYVLMIIVHLYVKGFMAATPLILVVGQVTANIVRIDPERNITWREAVTNLLLLAILIVVHVVVISTTLEAYF